MLVLCDFDGTITLQDVTNTLLDHFVGSVWRDTVLADYRAGRINHLQIMQGSYGYLKTPLPELLAYSRQTIQYRPGFEQLISYCREQGHRLVVVSGGLSWYLEAFLPPGLPYFGYIGDYDEARKIWEVQLPGWPSVDPAAGEDFKVRVMEELRHEYGADALPAIFIGDGRNDGPVAQEADRVFAVKDSFLTKICTERGQAFTPFTDFNEVIAALKASGSNPLKIAVVEDK